MKGESRGGETRRDGERRGNRGRCNPAARMGGERGGEHMAKQRCGKNVREVLKPQVKYHILLYVDYMAIC